jgi:hypothetical protein
LQLFLSIINLLISQSNDILWNYSLPIGNEAYKIIKLTNLFQLTMHDFQLFHKLRSTNEKIKNSFEIIELKFSHIGNLIHHLAYNQNIELDYFFFKPGANSY